MALQAFPQNRIFFISNRSYTSWITTIHWLASNGIRAPWYRVILTNTPDEKLDILRQAVQRIGRVHWIDDLTYNHERGQKKYYQHLIDAVTRYPIRFHGEAAIHKVNGHDQSH
jgi:hypothetical protein